MSDDVPFPPERIEQYRRDGLWTGETLGDALRRAAQAHPDLVGLGTRRQRAVAGLETLIVVRGTAPGAAHTYDAILAAGRAPRARAALAAVTVDPGAVVVLQLSGGTTGLPKVAPRRHEE